MKLAQKHAFLQPALNARVAKLPNRRTSYEILMSVVADKPEGTQNLQNGQSPMSVTSEISFKDMIARQNSKPLKAGEVKKATAMNEHGYMKVIMTQIAEDKVKRIQKEIERFNGQYR